MKKLIGFLGGLMIGALLLLAADEETCLKVVSKEIEILAERGISGKHRVIGMCRNRGTPCIF